MKQQPNSTRSSTILFIASLASVAWPGARARAQPQFPETGERSSAPAKPWHEGVSAADKRAASELFERGIEQHEQLLWDTAVALYVQALEHWPEHPEIHLYIARALDKLGRHPAAFEHLERALHWGSDGLKSVDQTHALRLRARLLARHVGLLEVTCDEPGALITLDGRPWFTGPGTQRKSVPPGRYELAVNKPGRFPVVDTTTVLAGRKARMELRMQTDRGMLIERRFGRWLPWVTVGVGVSVGLAGGFLLDRSRQNHRRYDNELQQEPCYQSGDGCDPAEVTELTKHQTRARWQERVAIGLFALGSAAVVTGSILATLNRPYRIRDKPTLKNRWQVTPIASRDRAGVWISKSF